jgi:hypothetical protein
MHFSFKIFFVHAAYISTAEHVLLVIHPPSFLVVQVEMKDLQSSSEIYYLGALSHI